MRNINTVLNPAEQASKETLSAMFLAIENNQCFRLEAGAGAGRTYSLIEALKYTISKYGKLYLKQNRKIACITYTNVAKDEINSRLDNHPIVYAETIHAFSWNILKNFQKEMRSFIPSISEKWETRIAEIGGIKNQTIKYDLGYPSASEEEITLHHNDVIDIMTHFLALKKFRAILESLYPVLFIDEYQDTNNKLALAIKEFLIEADSKMLIGLFGDHWQKIYGHSSCGIIESTRIKFIGKNANFRSDKNIVDVLNNMRPELPQFPKNTEAKGEIDILHTNSWVGNRRTGGHWGGDLPVEVAHEILHNTIIKLTNKGWDFSPEHTKILMLTNNILAAEQNYLSIASTFSNTDDYLKKNDEYIKFFVDTIEPVCEYYSQRKFGKITEILGGGAVALKKAEDKILWKNSLDRLIELRISGTIGDVIEHLQLTKQPRLSYKIEDEETKFQALKLLDDIPEEEKSFFEKTERLKAIKYSEVITLTNYINDKTPFSTKHGVKGAEFENVLVVCGRGWNQYNWNQMLEWSNTAVPDEKIDTFERNRNLFYVACSRPKKRLAILFTQQLSSLGNQNFKEMVWDSEYPFF